MKVLHLVMAMLISNYALAQSPSPFSNINLQDDQVVFEATYDVGTMTTDSLKNRLSHYIPTVQGLRDYQIQGDVITGVIEKSKVDYKKYGGRQGTTAIYLNDPFTANISVIWKEGKYKVRATNIVFHNQLAGTIYATNLLTKGQNNRRWVTGKTAVQAGIYLDKYLHDLFVLSDKDVEW